MATGFDAWALSLVIFTPIVGLAAVLLWPRDDEQGIKVVTLVTTPGIDRIFLIRFSRSIGLRSLRLLKFSRKHQEAILNKGRKRKK